MLGEAVLPNDKLLAALAMAERGLAVFPIKEGAKFPPLLSNWPEQASVDPAVIAEWWRRWPEANIGVHCKDHIVVDVDVKGGKPGLASLMDLEIDLDTFTVDTPTGGLHVYYTGPNVKNSVGALGPGLDVRSDHGYVLAPGSTVGGCDYAIRLDTRIAASNEGLVGKLVPNTSTTSVFGGVLDAAPRSTTTPAIALDTLPAVDRATHFLRDEARLPVAGHRDHTAFEVACVCKDFGLSQHMTYDLMAQHWNDRGSPPLPDEHLREKVANAYRYGALAPGVAAPEHQFEGVTVHEEAPSDPGWFHHGDPIAFDQAWLFYNTLPAAGLVLVTGPTGAGKTFLITEMARCLATGKPLFGVEPDDVGATLFLSAGTEGSGLEMRLAALGEPGRLPIAARTLSTPLSSPNALVKLQEEIEQKATWMQEQHGVPVRMVVFETLSASGLLKDENDNSEAGVALGVLAAMARRMNAMFVTSHHPPKNGVGSRGASALDANVDYVIEIDRDGKASTRNVELRKARNAPERALGSFSLVPVVLGQDSRGRAVSSCVVSMGFAVPKDDDRMSGNAEIFMECLDFAIIDVLKTDPEATRAENGAIRDYFMERCKIKDRHNRNAAYRKAKSQAVDLGAVVIENTPTREWISKKEPIE